MKNSDIFRSLGGIRSEWIEEAAPSDGDKKTRKIAWAKWTAAAAAFLLLAVSAVWLFVPGLEARADMLQLIRIPVDEDVTAVYAVRSDMTHAAELALPGKLGAQLPGSGNPAVYKLRGHDDMAALIAVREDGTYELCELYALWNDDGVPADVSLGYVLEKIYGVSSAEDLRTVSFGRIDEGFVRTEKKPEVRQAVIRDAEDVARVYEILSPLAKSEVYFPSAASGQAREYLTGNAPHPVQTSRKVTLTFANGTSLDLTLDLYHGIVRMRQTNTFSGFSEEDSDWLTALADVRTEYVDYGIAEEHGKEPLPGEETDAPRPVN